MSGGYAALQIQEDDVTKMLAATTHIGSTNSETTMEQYIFKRSNTGVNNINLRKTWEKLLLAARAIAAIENPLDVFVVSCKPHAQRAVLKFASHVGTSHVAGRFTPGAFTNQIQAAFREPRILIVADPRADAQPVTESSYANIPVIAFCNTDSPTKFIDIAIPCSNKAPHSIGLMFWLLAREVLRLKGTLSREIPWDVMPDLYFYRDPEEAEKEEAARQEQAALPAPAAKQDEDWDAAPQQPQTDWAAEPAAGIPPAPAAAALKPGVGGVPAFEVQDDWGTAAVAPPAPAASDWAAETAAPEPMQQWGGASQSWT